MKILIAAGGTGGHIYPGIAIAQEIKRRDPRAVILFVGSRDGLEKELVPRAGFKLKLIPARALLRKLSYKAVSAPFFFVAGFVRSLILLNTFRPNWVLVTGGYVSLPVALAARLLNIPVALQEQNVLPGMVSRIVRRFAKKVFLAWPETLHYFYGEVVGNPVRQEILRSDRESARRELGFQADDRVVLILGGSQGSRRLNQMAAEARPKLPKEIKLIHIVGRRDFPLYPRAIEYMHDMSQVLAAADLVVSRAGATAISEFLVKGVPMILVPFPYAALDHQRFNARAVAAAGAGLLIEEKDLTAEKLLSLLHETAPNYAKMKLACAKFSRPKAAERIVDQLYAPI